MSQRNILKGEKEIAKEKESFVCNDNYDSWSNRSPPWTQKKTLQSIILDDCTDEKKYVPKIRTLKESNISISNTLNCNQRCHCF